MKEMELGEIVGRSAWLGRDLQAQEDEWIYRLNDAEIAEIDSALRHLQATGRQIETPDRSLPGRGTGRLRCALERLGRRLGRAGPERRQISAARGQRQHAGTKKQECSSEHHESLLNS